MTQPAPKLVISFCSHCTKFIGAFLYFLAALSTSDALAPFCDCFSS
jgi:hypothetical protein